MFTWWSSKLNKTNIIGVSLDGNVPTFTREEENLCDGYEINPLSKKDGGIEIYPKYLKNNNLNKKKYFKMITKKNEILIFHSNLCYHRAGNPDRNRIRSQIMFQLNPSANWSFCEDIWFKQKKLEPKFPLIYDLFTKKINIKTSK